MLGIAYNVFDGEELLVSSVKCMRPIASYIVIVYQTKSNWGHECSPTLMPILQELLATGYVDQLIEYTPQFDFDMTTRRLLTSKWMVYESGGSSMRNIQPCFYNELRKRQIGLDCCRDQGKCDYFISMDSDEYYKASEVKYALQFMETNPQYDVSACLMRLFFKRPQYEILPVDNVNHVVFLVRTGLRLLPHQQSSRPAFALGHPYPVLVDPTRRLLNCHKIKLFTRNEVVMYHYSYVRTRRGMRSKCANVSNRQNYAVKSGDELLAEMDSWEIKEEGGDSSKKLVVGKISSKAPPHPLPVLRMHYTHGVVVENWFDIPDVYEDDS